MAGLQVLEEELSGQGFHVLGAGEGHRGALGAAQVPLGVEPLEQLAVPADVMRKRVEETLALAARVAGALAGERDVLYSGQVMSSAEAFACCWTSRRSARFCTTWVFAVNPAGASGASTVSAAKSLVNTKVSVYSGFCSPVTRLLPVQR